MFTTGQTMAAKMIAAHRLFLLRAVYTSPAIRPHSVPFTRTVTMVPRGLTARKAAACPAMRITAPDMRPSHAPTFQPYTAAPTTMGTRDTLMFSPPIWKVPPKN